MCVVGVGGVEKGKVGEMNWMWLTDVGFLGRPGRVEEVVVMVVGGRRMSGVSIGIIVPCVQAWTQTPDRWIEIHWIDRIWERVQTQQSHSSKAIPAAPPIRHQQDELMHINERMHLIKDFLNNHILKRRKNGEGNYSHKANATIIIEVLAVFFAKHDPNCGFFFFF